jgi:hypothetical protein
LQKGLAISQQYTKRKEGMVRYALIKADKF